MNGWLGIPYDENGTDVHLLSPRGTDPTGTVEQSTRFSWHESNGLVVAKWHGSGQSSAFARRVFFAGNNQEREHYVFLPRITRGVENMNA